MGFARVTSPIDHRKTLPSLSQAARLLETTPTRMTRALKALEIEPDQRDGREKFLGVEEFLRVAAYERRISLEEAASAIIDWVEDRDRTMVESVEREVQQFLAEIKARRPRDPQEFLADLKKALPPRYAAIAERIFFESGAARTK